MPDTDSLLGRVDIVVESVEVDTYPSALTVGTPLSLLITVTSHQESPRLRVEPRRFHVEADKSTSIQARPTSSKDPPLASTYLRDGASVSGWLTFEVPPEAKELVLKSDMKRPPLEIPIAIPGAAPVKK
jgi:hypothetical protein